MTLSLKDDADWRAILAHLPGNYAQLAVEHKQLQTQYGNAKITSAEWLLRFILLHVGANLPLLQTVTLVAEAGGPTLSPMRLHMKMRRAAPYLQALVEKMVPWRGEAKPEFWAGYSMTLVDSTTVCGPGATGTDARIHTKIRAADLSIADAVVTDGRGGETFKRFSFEQDELVLADRGYANHVNIARAAEHGAAVLIRYNRGSLPLWTSTGKPFDALETARALGDGAIADLDVVVTHDEDIIRGRFIAVRLPESDAADARKRVRKEYGKKASPELLEAAGYVMLFTTVPRERMSAAMCLQAYRLRWQIELQFKRWKSLCGFDRLPNYRDDTIVAWLYAKVLLGLVLDRMASGNELSPPVQLEPIAKTPRRPRRVRRGADARAGAVEAHEHPVPDDRRRAAAALSA
jgi:Transposase DDE domain